MVTPCPEPHAHMAWGASLPWPHALRGHALPARLGCASLRYPFSPNTGTPGFPAGYRAAHLSQATAAGCGHVPKHWPVGCELNFGYRVTFLAVPFREGLPHPTWPRFLPWAPDPQLGLLMPLPRGVWRSRGCPGCSGPWTCIALRIHSRVSPRRAPGPHPSAGGLWDTPMTPLVRGRLLAHW